MSFDFSTLVTDRTQVDVSYVKQIAEKIKSGTASESELAAFNGAIMRGSYNYTDLNRVTEAMEYLVAILNKYGYAVDYRKIKVPHAKPKKLPDGYTKLTYIESTGTQYIDTKLKPNQDTRVLADFYLNDFTSVRGVFGSRTSGTLNGFAFFQINATSLYSYYGTNNVGFSVSSSGGRFLIDKNKNLTTVNEVTHTVAEQEFTGNANMHLFAVLQEGDTFPYAHTIGKLYFCEIYDNNVLARDFVPCINPENEVGLYDLVENKFHGNGGTGVFIAGDVAEEHKNSALDSYRWYESDIPTASHMQQYVDNVEAVRSVLKSAGAAPKNMNGLTVSKANEIEKILINTELIIRNMIAAFIYSGQVYSGMMWEGF